MKNRRKRRDDGRRERFTLLYASTFRFDAKIGEKSPGFWDFARNCFSRRRKLAAANAFSPKLETAADKKSRRSNRRRFERRRFNVARAAPLGSNVSDQRERKTNSRGSAAPTIRPGLPAFRLRALRSRPALRLRPLRPRRVPLCRRLALSSGCRSRRRWSSRGA